MTINNILIVDTETNGLDPKLGAQVIEVGAILYNVQHRTILQSYSTLLPCDENPVENINHISAESTRCKMPTRLVIPILSLMCDEADYLVAHNAQFDRKFMDTILPQPVIKFSDRKWICTKSDFKWPVPLYRNRLQDICNAMGVPYVDAHRALSDCNLLAQCFGKIHDLEERISWASRNSFGNGNNYR